MVDLGLPLYILMRNVLFLVLLVILLSLVMLVEYLLAVLIILRLIYLGVMKVYIQSLVIYCL